MTKSAVVLSCAVVALSLTALPAIPTAFADASAEPKPVAIGSGPDAGSVVPPIFSDDEVGLNDDIYYGEGDYNGDYNGFSTAPFRDFDLDQLFADLFGNLQGLADQNFTANATQIGSIDALDIQGLLDGVFAEIDALLSGMDFDQLFQDVGSLVSDMTQEVQPVIDAALACASDATELAPSAQRCMESLWSSVGSGMGGEGMPGLAGLIDLPMLENATALCTAECRDFLGQVSTVCPDLAANLLNDTSVEDTCGLQSGGRDTIVDVPDMPVALLPEASSGTEAPVVLPETPADTKPVLIPLDPQPATSEGGTTFSLGANGNAIEGVASSSGSGAFDSALMLGTAVLGLAVLA